MNYIQLSKRTYRDEKVPRDSKPVFAFNLDDHETIVGIAASGERDRPNRKTVDYWVTVWVAVNCGQIPTNAWEGVPTSVLGELADEAGFDPAECC